MEPIKVKKLRPGATLPTYGTEFSAGADLYACLEEPVTIAPGETKKIPTGLAMEIPVGCAGLIYARSSLGTKQGLIFLHNHGAQAQTISHGDRVAQLLVTPVFTPGFVEAEELTDTLRGTGGFGSTGK